MTGPPFLSQPPWTTVKGSATGGITSVVKFEFAPQSQLNFFPFFLGSDVPERKNFITELDKDDIEELIKELETIKSILIRESGE